MEALVESTTATKEPVSHARVYGVEVFDKYLEVLTEIPAELKSFLSRDRSRHRGWRHETRLKKSLLLTKQKTKEDDGFIKETVTEILNRISEKNFEENCRELMSLEVKTQKQLDDYVEVVFVKAIRERAFSKIYAQLCRRLLGCYVEKEVEVMNEETKETQPGMKKVYFRDLLINRCQNMFERSTSVKQEGGKQEDLFKVKGNVLGCMNFIGDLYNLDILTDKIIYSCFLMLNLKLPHQYLYTVDSMCMLFVVAGKKFFQKNPKRAQECLGFLVKAKDTPGLPNKDRFAIMDIIDEFESLAH